VDRSSERCCQLFVSLESPWGYRHRGFSEMLEPGDAVLIGDGEHETSLPHGFNGIILKCPTRWVDTWLPDVTPLLGRRIAKDSRWGRVLSPMVRSLTPRLVADSPLTHAVLADQLGTMLTLIGGEAESHRDRALFDRLSAAILERCTEISLSAVDIATPLGLTPPELQRVLASRNTSFLRLLNEARVDHAKALLRQPSWGDRTIADIGRQAGFAGTANFSRVFHRHTGQSPAEFRRLDA
jgi:AraC-like DNA-binding protein